MSNTMTAHEPLHYLDSILNEEEKRCEYSHQWRNFTISRSGRFKSKNKKRDVVDGKLFDAASTSTSKTTITTSTTTTTTTSASMTAEALTSKEGTINNRMAGKQEWHTSSGPSSKSKNHSAMHGSKGDSYKSFYETNF